MGSTHRRRRSTLAVVVMVTAVVGVRLTGAGAVPTAAPAAIPSAPATVSTAPAPTTPVPTTPVPTPSASTPPASAPPSSTVPPPSATASAPAVGTPPACASDAVRVGALAAIGDADSALVAGSPVRFTLRVSSAADTACTFAPVPGFTVVSGKDRIWTSGDCPVAAVGGPGTSPAPTLTGTARALLVPGGTLLGARATATLNLVWPGVRSTGSCAAVAPALRAGTYVATVEIPGAGTAGTAFQLR